MSLSVLMFPCGMVSTASEFLGKEDNPYVPSSLSPLFPVKVPWPCFGLLSSVVHVVSILSLVWIILPSTLYFYTHECDDTLRRNSSKIRSFLLIIATLLTNFQDVKENLSSFSSPVSAIAARRYLHGAGQFVRRLCVVLFLPVVSESLSPGVLVLPPTVSPGVNF